MKLAFICQVRLLIYQSENDKIITLIKDKLNLFIEHIMLSKIDFIVSSKLDKVKFL